MNPAPLWPRSLHLVNVDDSLDERDLLATVVNELSPAVQLVLLAGFPELKEYLMAVSSRAHPIPDLILIDYHLGPHTGLDVLGEVLARPELLALDFALRRCKVCST